MTIRLDEEKLNQAVEVTLDLFDTPSFLDLSLNNKRPNLSVQPNLFLL